MKIVRLAVLLGAFLPGIAASAGPRTLEERVAPIASSLLKQSPLRGKRVAMGGFPDSDKRLTALSAMLAEDLELALVARASEGGFKMMDRRNFSELAKEWELGMNGYVDDASVTQAGRLLGADVLCLGSYERVGKTVVVRATFVSAEKGEILAAAVAEIKLDGRLRDLAEKIIPATAPKPVPAAAETSMVPAEPLKVEVWADKNEHAVGEKMTLRVKVNQDCYLTLIDVGPSGKAVVLFPNHYAPNNAVKAGVTYVIPDPSAGFEFEVTPPAGVELIRAIASKAPTVDLKDAMEPVSEENPFGAVKKDLGMLTRDIHVKAKKAKPGEWSEKVLKLTIR